MELSRVGLHWEALDEDISISGLLAGRGDVTNSIEHAALINFTLVRHLHEMRWQHDGG